MNPNASKGDWSVYRLVRRVRGMPMYQVSQARLDKRRRRTGGVGPQSFELSSLPIHDPQRFSPYVRLLWVRLQLAFAAGSSLFNPASMEDSGQVEQWHG